MSESYGNLYPNATTALAKAFSKFPDVACAYRFSTTYDPADGLTAEAGFPRAHIARTPLPSILTSYASSTNPTTPDAALSDDYSGQLSSRRPVTFEYYDTYSANWLLCSASDGFAIDADGTFWLTGLREAAQTYKFTDPRTGAVVNSCNKIVDEAAVRAAVIVLRPLRATFAAPLDHRVTASAKLSVDKTKGVEPWGVDGNDDDRIDETLTRKMYLDTGELYRKEYRIDSWPEAQSVPGANNPLFEASALIFDTSTFKISNETALGNAADNATLIDDSELLKAAVRKRLQDHGRIDRGGKLIIPHIIPGIEVGTQISALTGASGSFPVRGVVQSVTYEFSAPQQTILEIA